ADEIVLLDIRATIEGRPPSVGLLRDAALECSMPLCYGGGIRTLDDVERIMDAGVEKVSLNSVTFSNPGLVEQAARRFGTQSVVVSIDVRRKHGRLHAYERSGQRASGFDPVEHARRMESCGAGELLVTAIERDGTRQGYDLDLVRAISD